jgi:hypothetical protein
MDGKFPVITHIFPILPFSHFRILFFFGMF